MKKKTSGRIPAVIIAGMALFAAIGSRTFLGACAHEDGSFGTCHYAALAVCGTALVIMAEGIAAAVWNNASARRGLFLSALLTGVLGILTPGTIIRLCTMASMRCRTVMRPSMMILFSLICVSAAAGMILTGEH